MEFLEFGNNSNSKLSGELQKLKGDENLLLVAFGYSNPEGIGRIRKLWKVRGNGKFLGRNVKQTLAVKSEELGGAVSLIRIETGKKKTKVSFLYDMEIPTPMGVFFDERTEELYVASEFSLQVIKGGKVVKQISNKLFNGLHAIKPSERGLYVVSTAMDAVLEIDPGSSGKILWDWLATENGYDISANGKKRYVDRNEDYSGIEGISTPEHTTHINSVEEYNGRYLLASLFHQGEVILIDKKTGKSKPVITGLKNCHSVNKFGDDFVVSDTNGSRVIIFDKRFKVLKEVKGDFDWVQDAISFGDMLLIANVNQGKIEIFDRGFKKKAEVKYSPDERRLSAMIPLSVKDAKLAFT